MCQFDRVGLLAKDQRSSIAIGLADEARCLRTKQPPHSKFISLKEQPPMIALRAQRRLRELSVVMTPSASFQMAINHQCTHRRRRNLQARFLQSRIFTNFERLGAGSVTRTVDRRRRWRKHRFSDTAIPSVRRTPVTSASCRSTEPRLVFQQTERMPNISAPVELAGYGQEMDWINAGIIHRMDTHNFRDRDGCWRACWTLLASNYSAISVWSKEFRRSDDVLRSALGSAALRSLRTDRI